MTNTAKKFKGFSDEEREAMRERARELQSGKTDGESVVLAAIAKLPEPDRNLAKRIHEIVTKTAPTLVPKTWYGFPAYATKDGKVVCFFQYASKFKTRYSTLGFSDKANLDEGSIWPVTYAVTKITPKEEAKIVELLKKAVA